MSAPIQHSVMYPESLSEGDVPPEEPSFSPPVFDVTSDNYSISDGDSHVNENNGPSRQSRAPLQAEGVTPAENPVTAGTSQRGWVRTMSRRMAESIAQGLHHVTHESITGETDEDLFHDSHLELQECMRNPIAFHAAMMGDIMYFECYCDSDFSGLWNKEFAPMDSCTAKSRSGWIIFYAGCPISWASKLP